VDGVVESGGVESHADGDEGVHLVVLLGDRIVLSILLEVLRPRNVDEDMAEHADRICITAHHHVGEAYIIVGREVCGHNAGEHGFLVELNIIKSLQRKTEVSEKAVDSQ